MDETNIAMTVATEGGVKDKAEPLEPRKQLVQKWQQTITEAKAFWRPVFLKIREEMEFVGGKQSAEAVAEEYQANITKRLVSMVVASAYAKNPKVIYRRRQKLDFTIYNGDPTTVQAARQQVAATQQAQAVAMDAAQQMGVPPEAAVVAPSAEALALIADYENGMANRRRLDAIGRTLELLVDWQLDSQKPPFKRMMKRMLRRACVGRVGWLRVNYRREEDPLPTLTAQTNKGFIDRVRNIRGRMTKLEEGITTPDSAEVEELKLMMKAAADDAADGVPSSRQGIELDFPGPMQVIVDPSTVNLESLDGCNWLAVEFMLSPDEILEKYKVNVREAGARPYVGSKVDGGTLEADQTKTWGEKSKALVWEVFDKDTGQRFVVCDGYCDFLEEPAEPMPQIERFFPLFAKTVTEADVEENEPESDLTCYGPSLVRLMMPMQNEWNRLRRSLINHRASNAPVYGLGGNATEADAKRLEQTKRGPTVIRFQGMQPGEDVNKFIQRLQLTPIDPAQYDTGVIKEDIMMVVGAQEANLGPAVGATATEASIAEGSRLATTSSLIDEMDEFLSEVAKAIGEIDLMEMPPDLVTEIVGAGAVFPEFDREAVKQQVYLQVQASSTGRPNKSVEVQNFQLLAPLLMQIPGIKPTWIARRGIQVLDDRTDLDEAFDDGAPSVQAVNAQMQAPVGPVPTEGPQGVPAAPRPPAVMERQMMASAGASA